MGAGILGLLFGVLISSVVLYFSVKIVAGDLAPDADFGKAVWVNILLTVIAVVAHMIPVVGVVINIVASFVVIMMVYEIGFFRTLLVWVVYVIVAGAFTLFVLLPFCGLAAFLS